MFDQSYNIFAPVRTVAKHTLYVFLIVFFVHERSGPKNIPLLNYNKKEYKEK